MLPRMVLLFLLPVQALEEAIMFSDAPSPFRALDHWTMATALLGMRWSLSR